jgi:predicted ABC-type ATPase
MPRLIMLAGPNGAGKSTYYKAYLRDSGLAFINADELAKAMHVSPEDAASFADKARDAALEEGLSFITVTIFSDPVGA